ncbi:hypothetical protein V8C86DRAFT_2580768 [Haematococcus lacustris]
METEEGVKGKLVAAKLWIKDYITAVREGKAKPFSPTERQVRSATRDHAWGPTGAQLNALAELSYDDEDAHSIFAALEYRLMSPGERWRNVYKALLVLEFLIKRGADCCPSMALPLLPLLQCLQKFDYISPDGKDVGSNVRIRSSAVIALLEDLPALANMRLALAERMRQHFEQWVARPLHPAQGDSSTDPAAVMAAASAPKAQQTDAQQAYVKVPNGKPMMGLVYDGMPGMPSSAHQLHEDGQAADSAVPVNAKAAVSTVEASRLAERLQRLLAQPGNSVCADCQAVGTAAKPTWASVSCGVFLCMRCAGIHRGLGTHISKVRSVTLDTWLPAQVAFMETTGNVAANQYFEAQLGPGHPRPDRESMAFEHFIRAKYEARRWAAPGITWPPPASTLLTPPISEASASDNNGQQISVPGTILTNQPHQVSRRSPTARQHAVAISGNAVLAAARLGPSTSPALQYSPTASSDQVSYDACSGTPHQPGSHHANTPDPSPQPSAVQQQPSNPGTHPPVAQLVCLDSDEEQDLPQQSTPAPRSLAHRPAPRQQPGAAAKLASRTHSAWQHASRTPAYWAPLGTAVNWPMPASVRPAAAGMDTVDPSLGVLEWLDRQHMAGHGLPHPTSMPTAGSPPSPVTPYASGSPTVSAGLAHQSGGSLSQAAVTLADMAPQAWAPGYCPPRTAGPMTPASTPLALSPYSSLTFHLPRAAYVGNTSRFPSSHHHPSRAVHPSFHPYGPPNAVLPFNPADDLGQALEEVAATVSASSRTDQPPELQQSLSDRSATPSGAATTTTPVTSATVTASQNETTTAAASQNGAATAVEPAAALLVQHKDIMDSLPASLPSAIPPQFRGDDPFRASVVPFLPCHGKSSHSTMHPHQPPTPHQQHQCITGAATLAAGAAPDVAPYSQATHPPPSSLDSLVHSQLACLPAALRPAPAKAAQAVPAGSSSLDLATYPAALCMSMSPVAKQAWSRLATAGLVTRPGTPCSPNLAAERAKGKWYADADAQNC